MTQRGQQAARSTIHRIPSSNHKTIFIEKKIKLTQHVYPVKTMCILFHKVRKKFRPHTKADAIESRPTNNSSSYYK